MCTEKKNVEYTEMKYADQRAVRTHASPKDWFKILKVPLGFSKSGFLRNPPFIQVEIEIHQRFPYPVNHPEMWWF